MVRDGVIVRSGLEIEMVQSPLARGAIPTCCGSELIISVVSRGSLGGEWHDEERIARHPDYDVHRPGGCTFCLMGRATYVDSLATEDANRLSDFQLSCATRWSSCLTLEELDPAARDWQLYEPPWGDAPGRPYPIPDAAPLCRVPLYARARDAEAVLLVEAMDDSRDVLASREDLPGKQAFVRVLSDLKNGKHPYTDGEAESVLTYGRNLDDGRAGAPVSLAKGARYLFILNGESSFDSVNKRLTLGPCEVEGWTATGEAEVRRGIGLDHLMAGREPKVSVQGFYLDPAVAGYF